MGGFRVRPEMCNLSQYRLFSQIELIVSIVLERLSEVLPNLSYQLSAQVFTIASNWRLLAQFLQRQGFINNSSVLPLSPTPKNTAMSYYSLARLYPDQN